MKKFWLTITSIILVIMFLVSGCGATKPEPAKTTGTTQASEKKTEPAKELKLAYTVTSDGTDGQALQKFADIIKEKTGGKYVIKQFPNSQLGSEREITEAMLLGTIDMVFTGFAPVSWYAPQYECLDGPFVVTSYEQMDKIYKGEVIKEVSDALLKAKGIRVLDYWYRGPRYVTSNKEIKSVADMKGFKIRVPETPLYIEAFKLLGSNPTPIAFKELFLSLKQGVVDGQENPLELIYTSSFFEAQKYVVKTEHNYSTHILSMSDKFFGSLTPDEQKIFQEAAVQSGKYEYELLLKSEKDYAAKLQEKGMKFIDVDKESFKAAIEKGLVAKFADKWKPGFYESVVKLK